MSRKDGQFWHNDEMLTVNKIADGSEYEGMYEVFDSEGFQLAVAFTRKIAVQMAIDEIEYVLWHLDAFLSQLFGEPA